MKDEYFTMKKCGRVDLRIISPNSMPDSMQVRVSRTCQKMSPYILRSVRLGKTVRGALKRKS